VKATTGSSGFTLITIEPMGSVVISQFATRPVLRKLGGGGRP
jgi:hypothetical protein